MVKIISKNYDDKDLKENLADYAHTSWSGWMKYMFNKSKEMPDGSILIPPDLAQRWKRQANTTYDDLPESEKKSDRDEADKIISIFQKD